MFLYKKIKQFVYKRYEEVKHENQTKWEKKSISLKTFVLQFSVPFIIYIISITFSNDIIYVHNSTSSDVWLGAEMFSI